MRVIFRGFFGQALLGIGETLGGRLRPRNAELRKFDTLGIKDI